MTRSFHAVFLLASVAAAQPSKAPVPPQFLSGDNLVIRAANFSVPLPSSAWRWERLIPSEPNPFNLATYVCVNSTTNEYYVLTVHNCKSTSVSGELVAGFLRGVRESDPEIAKSMETKPVRVGAFDSLRFHHLRTYPTIGRQHTFGYVVATGHLLTIQTVTPEADEPGGLKAFVASLRLLRP